MLSTWPVKPLTLSRTAIGNKPCQSMAVLLLLYSMLTPLYAENRQNYRIPAQSLDQALVEFSQASGLQVMADGALTQGKRSPGVSGAYSPEQALQQLLSSSGLKARHTNPDTITVEKNRPSANLDSGKALLPLVKVTAKPDDNGNDTTTLPKVTVEADASYDPDWAKDPYNPDYVLPNATMGTKTDTPVMETPLNVQVISKQVLKDQQVINLSQALRNVSGVNTTKNAGAFGQGEQVFLRGFPTNTIFRNGFRNDGGALGFGQQFANVESVEVLKGPAAILYGRVEPGGAVNIVTKQPMATPYYALNQQFGSYDLYRTSVDATGPLTKDDTLLYRMNASFQSNNSFRDLVSNENVFLAPVIRWNISPRTQATLEMEYQHQNHSQDTQVLPFDINNNRIIDNLPHSRNLGERNRIETETIFLGFNWSHQFNDDWSIKNQVVYKREDNKLGVIAFPVDINQQTRLVDRALFGPLQHNIDQVATILDLTGHFKTWGLEHTLLMGGDYYNFKGFQNGGGGPNSSINLDNPVHPSPGLNLAVSDNSQSPFNSDNYGLYAQDQIKLPYHLHVMGGLRYQYVHQTNGNGSAGNVVFDSQTDDAVTPRVGLLWQPQKWLSLYSNYAENFGANTGRGFQNKSLPPESAQQWEVGAKTEFFDGRLRATLAYYDLTKQNVATKDTVHQKDPFCVGNGGCVAAVGEVRSRGPELDIQGELLPGWNVIATYANQDVRVSKSNDTAASGSTNLVGNRLQFVPRNIGTFWSTYEVQKGDLKGFKVGGGVTVQDGVVDATNAIKSPGYALVNLLAGYSFEVGKSKITAQLNVDNLLDKSYFTNASAFGNVGYVTFSTPRTFMGSINVQY